MLTSNTYIIVCLFQFVCYANVESISGICHKWAYFANWSAIKIQHNWNSTKVCLGAVARNHRRRHFNLTENHWSGPHIAPKLISFASEQSLTFYCDSEQNKVIKRETHNTTQIVRFVSVKCACTLSRVRISFIPIRTFAEYYAHFCSSGPFPAKWCCCILHAKLRMR